MANNQTKNTTLNVGQNEIIIVMDGYGGDWTPSAAMVDPSEATKLQKLLSQDAQAVCSVASWFESEQDVATETPTPRPDNLPAQIAVCFCQDTALAASTDDLVARGMQIKEGGLRGKVTVFDSVESVVEEKPSVAGKFIDMKEATAQDYLENNK